MAQQQDVLKKKYSRLAFLAAAVGLIAYFIVLNIGVFGNVLIVLIGFGAVIIVHEFGHFAVAKLCGIKVEAFSIGFSPVLLGIMRTAEGYRIRVLPGFFPVEEGKDGDGCLCTFKVGGSRKPGETEYRIGLLPFGGFVKMLGQEDVGSVKATDDPRSFVNKPLLSRTAVIAAGVLFNAVSAIAVFMIVFLIGIKLPPPVIGGVALDSPAAKAGLKGGDEIVEINGQSNCIDFSNIVMAAALSNSGEKVPMKVKHLDGRIEDIAIAAEQMPGEQIKVFGISRPVSLTVDNIIDVNDINMLKEKTGLMPFDRITAVNGRPVSAYWDLADIVNTAYLPFVTLTAERRSNDGPELKVEAKIRLEMAAAQRVPDSEEDLSNIFSMVPRLIVTDVQQPKSGLKGRFLQRRNLLGKNAEAAQEEHPLRSGDVILSIGDIDNPTYEELRNTVEKYNGKKLPMEVLRRDGMGIESSVAVTVSPKKDAASGRVLIGIVVALDAEHPVVAKTVGDGALDIPRGAAITAVGGVAVADYYGIISQLRKNAGKQVKIEYIYDGKKTGSVLLAADEPDKNITVRSGLTQVIPFEDLKRTYKFTNPADAVRMGYNKTFTFIAQSYITLKRLLSGLISPKQLMGPVGILTYSYRIVAEQSLVYYAYWLGLISASIAVMNFLPLPPLDGGLIVVMFVEKIKGSALSMKTQEIIAYAGWVLIGSLLLYVTFNDVVRSFFQ